MLCLSGSKLFDILMVFVKEFFSKKVDLNKVADDQKECKISQ